jgi:DNA recombination protein RmuC
MQSYLAQPFALQALIGGAAALVGILAGILIRGALAKSEKQGMIHRNEELANALTQAGNALSESMALAAKRAGFESLAEEREKRIGELTTELEAQRAGSLVAVDAVRSELQAKSDAEAQSRVRISELETELRKERESLAEKVALLETAKKTLSDQFQALAADILDQKSKTLSEGSQKEIGSLLTPLREQINDFRKKVEDVQIDSNKGVTELKTLIGAMGNLNQALTTEAHNLATALRRDTKAQGNWGETILRNILDKSGLQEGVHYSFQQSFTEMNADGEPVQRRQTDVVVKLPGGRHLVIDSKVSLNAYNDSVNAEDEKDRAEALKRHLVSVRNHSTELAGRNYHRLDGIQSPDFVVMFVPIEPAFLLALQNDETLWHDAYAKGVLLSGPTTVLFVVRIVADLWRQEMQAQNVEKVMKRGAELYDKFVGFVANLEAVGDALFKARDKYDEALGQLSKGPGNLVRQVEMLRELGVVPKTKKQIPPPLLDAAGAEQVTIFEVGEENGKDAVHLEAEQPTLALAAEAEQEGAESGAV